jgi:hypothetical protein
MDRVTSKPLWLSHLNKAQWQSIDENIGVLYSSMLRICFALLQTYILQLVIRKYIRRSTFCPPMKTAHIMLQYWDEFRFLRCEQ